MIAPKLLPTTARNAAIAGVTYHIDGELVPVLTLELDYAMPVYFEHHILLWKDTFVEIGMKSLRGAFKRLLAGMPIFMTEVRGPGQIAFSRDGVGHVFPIHLQNGQGIDVREHQFLAATDTLDYTFTWNKGAANLLFGSTGLFIDTFTCHGAEGGVWLHGYGNVFEVTLRPGEQIDIEPGGWIYKDRTVQMETVFQGLKTGIFASAGQLFFNRFTGPGRIALQSMSMPMTGGSDTGGGSAQPGAGDVVGGLFKIISGN